VGNSYGYDAWGNLLTKTVTKCGAENMSLTADGHNWLHAAGTDYQYDAAGNMSNDGLGHSLTYDAESRISQINGGAVQYTYDPEMGRVRKDVSGQPSTEYYYFGNEIVAEQNVSTGAWTNYVFFGGDRVARREYPSGDVSYYFSDHLKTASVIADATGTIKAESDYYPWGGELQLVANDTNHYKFTGKERDAESGLDYFGARYYSNGLGRWVSADWSATPVPVPYADFGDPQTLNQYSYVRNLPTTRFDADGHQDGGGSLFIGSGPMVCGLCNVIVAAYREIRSNPRQAASDAGNATKAFVQNTINLLPIGDKQPAPGVKVPPAVVPPPNSAVGTLTTGGLAAGTLLLPGPKGAGAVVEDANLGTRAAEIHGALDPIAQNMRTTAVANVTNADGTVSTMVSSSRNTVAPAQRAVLQPGETAVSGAGHAEETILNSAHQNGQTVNNMGVTRTPCASCQQKLGQAGVNVTVKKTPD
jgi:RHS repeat-associated protein